MVNILDYDLNDLKIWMKTNSESPFRAKQVFDWIYKGIWSFEDMNNISVATKSKLLNNFYIEIPQVVHCLTSNDEGTHKYILKYRDGNIIEAVLMKYHHGNSICVSTQIGCRMGCKFCASTIDGLVRNITCGEILGQILSVENESKEKISNIVLMGSGEPFDNFENVFKFIKIVNSDYGLNIGQRHITLSTCGIVPKIIELADLNLQITLAISLHAPNDESRRKIMPIANKYSISEILDACKYYIEKTNKRVTFEYAIVRGVNDSEKDAIELANLLRGLLCHINIIPVNEVKENNFVSAPLEEIKKFEKILLTRGIQTTIRREMGADINAACGQLRRRYIEGNIKGC